MTPNIRFVLGKSQANGFTSFCDGDLFEQNGEIFKLTNGGNGWTLRRTIKADGYRTDYSAPPLDGWIEMAGAMDVIQRINQVWANAN